MQGNGDRPTEREDRPPARPSEAIPEERRLDSTRYPWQWQVHDRAGRKRPLGYGTDLDTDGNVVIVGVGPDYWTTDPDTFMQITFARTGVYQRAVDMQAAVDEQRRHSNQQPGS
ncbi:MAG: hypothetical protein WBA97_17030 [Actinophytocola sp.]|uniref:hypothetical protein n=1 Tax=Actinophytocola sp. TaxID=1872138 RepID=UPI003C776A74